MLRSWGPRVFDAHSVSLNLARSDESANRRANVPFVGTPRLRRPSVSLSLARLDESADGPANATFVGTPRLRRPHSPDQSAFASNFRTTFRHFAISLRM